MMLNSNDIKAKYEKSSLEIKIASSMNHKNHKDLKDWKNDRSFINPLLAKQAGNQNKIKSSHCHPVS